MGVLVLFFDGIGIGRADARRNPFAAIGARRLGLLAGRPADDGSGWRALDATLGLPGLPQSATGQTTLLTGVNAARVAGRHQTGLPGPSLRPLIERESLFLKLVRAGLDPTFANAYTREHLEAERPRWSASTRSVMAAGLPFRMWDREGLAGQALFHDYTGEWPRRRGYEMATRDADGAAAVLVGLLAVHDFVLYEYFLTDLMAHRGDWEQQLEQARRVEALVDGVLRGFDRERDLVVVVSDHGNLEDAGSPQHTRNPAPFLVWGDRRDELLRRVETMENVTPAIMAFLTGE